MQREEETSTQNRPISMARVLEDESSPHLGCSMGRALTEEIGQVEQSTTTQSRDIVSSTPIKVYTDALLEDVSQ